MSRAHELQEAFAKGLLPEQQGRAPATSWCEDCKGSGQIVDLIGASVKRKKCESCSGRGIVARAHE